ncbi:MAG TPA: helical backbone metal receptor, partial [Marmoricola sp.]|nr:helical backbone metal receptor [Marmoricola sp.]
MSELDDLGTPVPVASGVSRVVSLVPSLTEAVAATERDLLAGCTDWCTHPHDLDAPRIGGTKNPRVADVLDLRPDVVLANEEENRAADLEALRAAGAAVWVTRVRTVPEGIASLHRMLTVACRLPRPGWLDEAEAVWRDPFQGPRRRAVVPIWRRPWMAVGRDTFTGDVLARLGVDNVLAGHAERYPKVDLAALPSHDLVVLPDEPYAFTADDGPESFPGRDVALVSGRHLTWYGPSLVEARS